LAVSFNTLRIELLSLAKEYGEHHGHIAGKDHPSLDRQELA
jgi:hypothetical protein